MVLTEGHRQSLDPVEGPILSEDYPGISLGHSCVDLQYSSSPFPAYHLLSSPSHAALCLLLMVPQYKTVPFG